MIGAEFGSGFEGRANRPGEPFDVTRTHPERKYLGHRVPGWVKPDSLFFITVCAATRIGQPLLTADRGPHLLDSVKHLHDSGAWYARLFVIMPDHVHGIVAFPPDTTVTKRISSWKGYTAKALGIEWQDRFFDHRIRFSESLQEKCSYIRMNPVRAGLVTRAEDWSFVFDPSVEPGSAGTPRPTYISPSAT